MKWQAVPSLINGGLHRMLKMNDDDNVMKMTEDVNRMQRMEEMASCAKPYQQWIAQNAEDEQ